MEDDPPPPYDFKEAPPPAATAPYQTPQFNSYPSPAQHPQQQQSNQQPSPSFPHPESHPTTRPALRPSPKPQLQPQPHQQQLPLSLSLLPFATPLHSHQPLGVYPAGINDVAIGLSASSPPLCHVTIHTLRTPSITLHANADPGSAPLGTAQYNFLSGTDIEIFAAGAGAGIGSGVGMGSGMGMRNGQWNEMGNGMGTGMGNVLGSGMGNGLGQGQGGNIVQAQLAKTSWLPDAWGFEMAVGGGGGDGIGMGRRMEQFEWRYSRGAEVAALDGRARGLKCVRVATGEIVCVWAWSVSLSKRGKFRWLLQGQGWGREAELMVVVTLLAVVERIRRDES